jgi:hypothetical protein
MSSPRIEVRIGGGEWFDVSGMALPLGGPRYRILITQGWRALRDARPEDITLRVDGALAAEVAWCSRPDGFATCEVVLGSQRLPVAGGPVKASAEAPSSRSLARAAKMSRG